MVAEKTWLQMCKQKFSSTMSIVAEHFYHQEFETKITKIQEKVKQRSKKKRHASRMLS